MCQPNFVVLSVASENPLRGRIQSSDRGEESSVREISASGEASSALGTGGRWSRLVRHVREVPWTIGGRSLALALGIVSVLVLGAVLLDYSSARRELEALARAHAEELTAVIEQGGVNSLLAMATVEDMVLARLLSAAHWIESLTRGRVPSVAELQHYAEVESLDVVVLWAERRPQSSWPDPPPRDWGKVDPLLEEVFGGTEEAADILETQHGEWYRAVVRGADGRAVAVGCDTDRLLPFRRQIGVGTMIRNLARSEDIVYIALQDTAGIIAATGNVYLLSSIASDSALSRALRQGRFVWRETEFGGERVFEAVRPFPLDEGGNALLRVGVSRAPLRNAQLRMISRIVVSTLVILLAGAFALAYLWTSQLASETRRAYHSVRTLSAGILERMGDGVVAVDREGKVQWANPAATRILGLGSAEMEGPLAGYAPALAEILRRTLDTGLPVQEPEVSCQLAGRERIFAVSASVLRDEAGGAETAFAVFRDLTEQVRLERQLARERRLTAMGQLASSIAHEIRNPLNAIGVIAQRLAREFSPQEEEEEYRSLTRTLVTETRRVNEIIQQFLEFARPPRLDKRLVALRDVLQSSVDLMKSAAAEKGIRLQVQLEEPVLATVDPDQLKQALVNLIQNAIQACEEGDQILLGLSADKDEVRIWVEDTGQGIAPEILPKIFDLYFTTRPEGTGIGLSLVHRIVSAHDGYIDVRSEVGKGTRFVLHLPRSEAS
jgi:PAS domain S-box-containing protein